MRRFLSAVLTIFALVQLGLWAGAARADSAVISNEVRGGYQEYPRLIGATNRGPLTLAPRETTPASAGSTPATSPEPEIVEPPFESPLADGTIVLSHMVAAQLDAYLADAGGQSVSAFFFVSRDGRQSGTYTCTSAGPSRLPDCPVKFFAAWADPRPDTGRVKNRASDACAAGGAGACVMLYAGETRRAEYKITDTVFVIPPKPMAAIVASTPTAPEPEEPPFESPLADGTIVLSHKVAARLDDYLSDVKTHGVSGFFFVSANGRQVGAYVCSAAGNPGLPACPMKRSGAWVDPHPDNAQVKKQAQDACRAGGAGDCVMLYYGNSGKTAFRVTDIPLPAQPAAPIAASIPSPPEPEEPPFESPLADGTIVLSRKVAAQLDSYLNDIKAQGVSGFFYVAPNGRHAGAFACHAAGNPGLPACPMKRSGAWVDPHPDSARVKKQASDACVAGGGGDCVMLYSGDAPRADYRPLD